ncbi:MAG: hypothetical protein LUD41_01030 [Phascolarctobacterium sp.]|nr:hypothetical protein [Phascolarctobacterium sp.]
MESYITTMETAEKWGLTNRRVQSYCVENRIAGAVRHGGVWFIPETAVKPDRIKQGVKKNPAKRCLNVLSLFSGCGGMDPCFEGGFDVLQVSVNEKVNPGWETRPRHVRADQASQDHVQDRLRKRRNEGREGGLVQLFQ